MTLTFDLSSWKWCTTYRPLMCCMYAIYEVSRSNKQETTDITKFQWLIWTWPLSFWSGNGAQHIVTSWVVRVSHMRWISEIGTELQSGHGKRIGTTFDLWSWKWCATPRHLMCCMYVTYEVIHPNKDGVMGRTRKKIRLTFFSNDRSDLDLLTWKWIATHCYDMDFIFAK